MKLKKRENGFYYIYYNRDHRKSLKTQNGDEATKLFNAEKKLIREGKVIEFEKVSRSKLSEFKTDYFKGADNLPNRELRVSPGTIEIDELAFKKFIEVIGDIPLRIVKRKHIEDFKAHCLRQNLTMTYINILLRSLRTAFNVALRAGYITENYFNRKKDDSPILFKLDDLIPRFFSLDELKALFDKITDPEFLFAVEIYLNHGIRRAELVRLQAQDIDFNNGFIKVFGKGRKERNVPIPEGYLETFKQKLKVEVGRIFPQWTSADTFSRLFHKYAKAAGIKGRLHDLRHSYATYLRMSGAGLDEIQKLLGHADIKTTQIYAKVVNEQLKQAANKLKFNFGGNKQ